MGKSIRIVIATHKKCLLPQDRIYLPLHVGEGDKGTITETGDDEGDNISNRNQTWGELTALYWAWKNLDSDYVGLVHYRRYLGIRKWGRWSDRVLTETQAERILEEYDIVLPKTRNYIFKSLLDHYNGHDFSLPSDMVYLRNVIEELSPEYLEAFDSVMQRRKGHMFNIFLMKRERFEAFCEWEFPILFALEKRLEQPDRNRIIAYIAEHMIDIWLEKNKYGYAEVGLVATDRKNELARRLDYLSRCQHLNHRFIKLQKVK